MSADTGTPSDGTSIASARAGQGEVTDNGELLGFESPPPSPSGYDALVLEATGRTIEENIEFHSKALRAALEQCLVERGFQVDEQFPGPGIDAVEAAPVEGQRMAIELMMVAASPQRNLTPAEVEASNACAMETQASVVDPLAPLWPLVAWYGEDARSAASSDPAFIAAEEERERCEAQFAAPPSDAQVEQLVNQFNEARARWDAGELSYEDLLAEGRRLRQQEIELEGGGTTCAAEYKATTDPIFARYEAQSVEEHAAAFNEAAAKMRDPSQIPPGTLPPLTSEP